MCSLGQGSTFLIQQQQQQQQQQQFIGISILIHGITYTKVLLITKGYKTKAILW